MSFADFLEVMHLQTTAEDLPKEVIEAFRAADTGRTGTIPARQLAHMLLRWGERLSSKEGSIFSLDIYLKKISLISIAVAIKKNIYFFQSNKYSERLM